MEEENPGQKHGHVEEYSKGVVFCIGGTELREKFKVKAEKDNILERGVFHSHEHLIKGCRRRVVL